MTAYCVRCGSRVDADEIDADRRPRYFTYGGFFLAALFVSVGAALQLYQLGDAWWILPAGIASGVPFWFAGALWKLRDIHRPRTDTEVDDS